MAALYRACAMRGFDQNVILYVTDPVYPRAPSNPTELAPVMLRNAPDPKSLTTEPEMYPQVWSGRGAATLPKVSASGPRDTLSGSSLKSCSTEPRRLNMTPVMLAGEKTADRPAVIRLDSYSVSP